MSSIRTTPMTRCYTPTRVHCWEFSEDITDHLEILLILEKAKEEAQRFTPVNRAHTVIEIQFADGLIWTMGPNDIPVMELEAILTARSKG